MTARGMEAGGGGVVQRGYRQTKTVNTLFVQLGFEILSKSFQKFNHPFL